MTCQDFFDEQVAHFLAGVFCVLFQRPATYKQICNQLYEFGLINQSWSMEELEGARLQFEQQINRLFNGSPTSRPRPPSSLFTDYYMISQYKKEFDEIEAIGSGGFGKVFRVKHKLDGTEYAVKKIPISTESINSVNNYLNEVKTLAALNHPNIVPYKAAWLELCPPSRINTIGRSSSDQQPLSENEELTDEETSSAVIFRDEPDVMENDSGYVKEQFCF